MRIGVLRDVLTYYLFTSLLSYDLYICLFDP